MKVTELILALMDSKEQIEDSTFGAGVFGETEVFANNLVEEGLNREILSVDVTKELNKPVRVVLEIRDVID